jgi:hypothetical protein
MPSPSGRDSESTSSSEAASTTRSITASRSEGTIWPGLVPTAAAKPARRKWLPMLCASRVTRRLAPPCLNARKIGSTDAESCGRAMPERRSCDSRAIGVDAEAAERRPGEGEQGGGTLGEPLPNQSPSMAGAHQHFAEPIVETVEIDQHMLGGAAGDLSL